MSPEDQIPTFRCGDVFPDDEASAALVRFLVSTRLLVVIARTRGYRHRLSQNDPSFQEDSPVVEEDRAFLMLASVATTKEAADAFRYADQNKCFAVIEKLGSQEQRDRLQKLRRECDKQDPQSLYCRLIKKMRDEAGAHWQLNSVKEALQDFEDDEIPIWEGAGDTFAKRTLPLARGVALHMSRINHPPKPESLQNAEAVAKLQGDLFHVAEAVYILTLQKQYDQRPFSL